MTFDDVTGDARLWAVRYDGEDDNELFRLFEQWNDVQQLRIFFKTHINDLSSYFKITNVNDAIADTIADSDRLQAIIMDISLNTNLDFLFRPLDDNRITDSVLEKEKARLKNSKHHASWLRIYAIKLTEGIYIITGGAIKLTRTMQEREHTKKELSKIDKVRRFLLNEGIVDTDGFVEYISEL